MDKYRVSRGLLKTDINDRFYCVAVTHDTFPAIAGLDDISSSAVATSYHIDIHVLFTSVNNTVT